MNSELYYQKKYLKYKIKYLSYKNNINNNLEGGFDVMPIILTILSIIVKTNLNEKSTSQISLNEEKFTYSNFPTSDNMIIFCDLIHCILCEYLNPETPIDKLNSMIENFKLPEINIQINFNFATFNITDFLNGELGKIINYLLVNINIPCKDEFLIGLSQIIIAIKNIGSTNLLTPIVFNVKSIVLYETNLVQIIFDQTCSMFDSFRQNLFDTIVRETLNSMNNRHKLDNLYSNLADNSNLIQYFKQLQQQTGGNINPYISQFIDLYLIKLEKIMNNTDELNKYFKELASTNYLKTILLCINILRIFKQIFEKISEIIKIKIDILNYTIAIITNIEKVLLLVTFIKCDIKDIITAKIKKAMPKMSSDSKNIEIIIFEIIKLLMGESTCKK
jgi:hypothetical protein